MAGPIVHLTADDVTRIVSAAIAEARQELLAHTFPMPEATTPSIGLADVAARNDHQHPRITQTFSGVLNASGQAVLVFAKSFAQPPGVVVVSVGAGALIGWDVAWLRSEEGLYIGARITGRRTRALPQLALATGLAAALTGYQPDELSAGSGFSAIVVKSSAEA